MSQQLRAHNIHSHFNLYLVYSKRTAALSLGVCKRYTSTAAAATSTSSSSNTAVHSDATTSSSRKRESLDPGLNRDKFLVGNPHPVSNLRPVKYPIPENESEEDRHFRERRERVDAFNQHFWVNNNAMFIKAKAEYEDKSKLFKRIWKGNGKGRERRKSEDVPDPDLLWVICLCGTLPSSFP